MRPLLLALAASCARPHICPAPEPPRTVRVTLRCLYEPPPEPPRYDPDPAIARAQLEQAYDRLAIWAYLTAWPSCRE